MVATGSDGYKAVVSAGEIAPNFGHKPDLVAYADTGGRAPVPDGFARIAAAGDVAGGRYVSNLADLHVGTAPMEAGTGGGTDDPVPVRRRGGRPGPDLHVSTLEALTPHTTRSLTWRGDTR